MDQRFRGIGHDGQKYTGSGWYVVPRQGFPNGCLCLLCNRVAVLDQVVWSSRRKCQKVARIPGVSVLNPNHENVMHKQCLAMALESAPLENYDTIRERIAAGGPLFDD